MIIALANSYHISKAPFVFYFVCLDGAHQIYLLFGQYATGNPYCYLNEFCLNPHNAQFYRQILLLGISTRIIGESCRRIYPTLSIHLRWVKFFSGWCNETKIADWCLGDSSALTLNGYHALFGNDVQMTTQIVTIYQTKNCIPTHIFLMRDLGVLGIFFA